MPLVIIVGHPCSGKSTRAKQLAAYFESKLAATSSSQGVTSVQIVSESEVLGTSRNASFHDTHAEKRLRSAFRAAVQRALSASVLVIADGLNHIKGLRYELHLTAKENATPHCTLFCDTPEEQCLAWNKARRGDADEDGQDEEEEEEEEEGDDSYSDKVMEDLLRRMEPPDGRRRWDKPLFVVEAEDVEEEDLPWAQMEEFLLYGKKVKPSVATVPQKGTRSVAVTALDRVTQDVIKAIVDAQSVRGCLPGDVIALPHTDVKFLLSRPLGLSVLRRLRRQYLKLMRVADVGARPNDELAKSFAEYLQTNS